MNFAVNPKDGKAYYYTLPADKNLKSFVDYTIAGLLSPIFSIVTLFSIPALIYRTANYAINHCKK